MLNEKPFTICLTYVRPQVQISALGGRGKDRGGRGKDGEGSKAKNLNTHLSNRGITCKLKLLLSLRG